MARTENIREKQRSRQETRRPPVGGRTYTYVEGNAVRSIRPQQQPGQEAQQKQKVQPRRALHKEKVPQLNMEYVIFLTAAAVITVSMCVVFLKVRAQNTLLQEEVTNLESELDAAILENDSNYNRVINSVDMENIKDIAINELGMEYAKKSQIVTYEEDTGDYVKQYSEIP